MFIFLSCLLCSCSALVFACSVVEIGDDGMRGLKMGLDFHLEIVHWIDHAKVHLGVNFGIA